MVSKANTPRPGDKFAVFTYHHRFVDFFALPASELVIGRDGREHIFHHLRDELRLEFLRDLIYSGFADAAHRGLCLLHLRQFRGIDVSNFHAVHIDP